MQPLNFSTMEMLKLSGEYERGCSLVQARDLSSRSFVVYLNRQRFACLARRVSSLDQDAYEMLVVCLGHVGMAYDAGVEFGLNMP